MTVDRVGDLWFSHKELGPGHLNAYIICGDASPVTGMHLHLFRSFPNWVLLVRNPISFLKTSTSILPTC